MGDASKLREAAERVIDQFDCGRRNLFESQREALADLRAAVAEAERLVPTTEERAAIEGLCTHASKVYAGDAWGVVRGYLDRTAPAPAPSLDDLARDWLADPGNDPARVRLWRRLDELSDRTYLFKAGDDKVSVRLRPGETVPDRHYPIEVS